MVSKKNNKNIPLFFMEVMTKVYVTAMVIVFPFFYLNHYINILEAKSIFFQVVTIPFVGIGLFFVLLDFVRTRLLCKAAGACPGRCPNGAQPAESSFQRQPSVMFRVCTAGLITVLMISCIFSPAGTAAFWGREGRYLGGLALLLCVLSSFLISRYFQVYQGFIGIFFIANGVQWLYIILQFWNMDPLSMNRNLVLHQHGHFLGTIGNINFIAGYTCVVLAIIMTCYCQCDPGLLKSCCGIAAGLGFYAGFATRSTSFFLGLGSVVLLLLSDGLHAKKKLKNLGELWMVFLAVSLLLKVMLEVSFFLGFGQKLPTLQAFGIDNQLKFMLSRELILFHTIGNLVWFFLRDSYQEKYYRILRAALLAFAAAAGMIMLIWLFPAADSFGNHRGYVWRITLEEFGKLPITQKLFGFGPNSFYQFVSSNHGAEMKERFGFVFVDAHNEGLQFLVTTGIIGVVSYFGLQYLVLLHCFQGRKRNPALFVGTAAIIAYMTQGLVNNPQIFITPLYFILIGILEKWSLH